MWLTILYNKAEVAPECFTDLENLKTWLWWFVLRLMPIFKSAPVASKKTMLLSKMVKKLLKNNHLASLV